LTLLVAPLILAVVGLLAAFLASIRVLSANPAIALRAE
jgi:hypothetical protein